MKRRNKRSKEAGSSQQHGAVVRASGRHGRGPLTRVAAKVGAGADEPFAVAQKLRQERPAAFRKLARKEGESDSMDNPNVIRDVVIISEGLGNKAQMRFYGPECIREGYPMFEGAKAFLDHSSESERVNRPERSVRDLCGFYTNPRVGMVENEFGDKVSAIIADLVTDDGKAGKEARAKARAARLYRSIYPDSREVFCGTSIDADGKFKERQVDIGDGTRESVEYVEAFTKVRSADIVTRPARGGEFLGTLESIALEDNSEEAQRMITEAQVKELAKVGTLLESARKKGDEKGVKTVLAEADAKLKALKSAAGIEAEDEDEDEDEAFGVVPKDPKMRQAAVAKARKFIAACKAAEDETEDEDEDEGELIHLPEKTGMQAEDEDDVPGDDDEEEDPEKVPGGEGGRKRMTASERDLSKTLRGVQLALKETQSELKGMKARAACEKALREAEIPENVLSIEELMKVPAAERPLWVKHAQKWRLAEESVGGSNLPRSAEARESMRESIRSKLAGKGIPVLGAKS